MASKYIVRDSAIEVHLGGKDGRDNYVSWTRCIFQDGKEVALDYMRRNFDTAEGAKNFSNILYWQFQQPAFAELEKDFRERNGVA